MSEDYPEMTPAEQDKRRAEMQDRLVQATDRSSSYWCERDTDGIPFMHCPDGSRRYWPPDKDPTKLSADRAHGDSLEYAVCPQTGQIHNAADTEWWTNHYGSLADAASLAKKAMQAHKLADESLNDLHLTGYAPVAEPDPYQFLVADLLEYEGEKHYGPAHVNRWTRALIAVGYYEEGHNGLTALTLDEVARNLNRFSSKRWNSLYEYLFDLLPKFDSQPQDADDGSSEDHGGRSVDVGEYSDSDGVGSVDIKGIVAQAANPKVDHSLRPGSPEWRKAQFESRIANVNEEWTWEDAREHYRSGGWANYQRPRRSDNGDYYWIGFELCDDGNWRQVDKPIARLLFKSPVQSVVPANDVGDANAAEGFYVYGQDLEEALKDAEAEHRLLVWTVIQAEIDFRMTNKANLPSFVNLDMVDAAEAFYPKIRLDKVREYLNG